MVGLAKQGKRVVRLKGGDPLIFARAGEEIAACKAAEIPVDIVPGITAAQGAASRLGISLTDRGHARRLQYVTGHARTANCRTISTGAASPIPPPRPRFICRPKPWRRWSPKAIALGLDPQTPALAIARATRPDQAVIADTVTSLPARLADAKLPGPLLVMIGRALVALPSHSPARRRRRPSASHRSDLCLTRRPINDAKRPDGKVLDIKREKGWTWKYICEQIGGMSPILITGAILGQMKLTKPQAANAAKLFGLSKGEQTLLNEVPFAAPARRCRRPTR